ncbi:MAG: ABC transporter permease [Saprospiraceae bacterium]
MIQNYVKIALRNLLRHKTFSVINVLGLAFSMSICLLIIMLVRDAHRYDRFHPAGDRVFRVLTDAQRKSERSESYASSPYTVAKTLRDELPQVELWTPLVRTFGGQLKTSDRSFNFSGMFTDGSFFDMFGFELASGDPETALGEPYAVVLTEELAVRLFGDKDPVGETLEAPGYAKPFRVTGVLRPFPGKTHLEFTALGSLATQLAEEKLPDAPQVAENWLNYYGTYNFVRLKTRADKPAAESSLATIAEKKYAGLELESRDASYRFRLQPLADITPGGMLSNSMGRGMPAFLVWFFSVLGAIVMLSACFNYTNLTIARSLVRTREVGVRKVLGASRWQVFGQFIGESVVLALLALVAGYGLMKLVKPRFEQLSISEALDVRVQEDAVLYGQFVLFAVLVGIIAGMLPALTLSKTSPLSVLQKLQNVKLIRRIGLRKSLLVVQFTVTLVFFIIVTIVWRQVDHLIVSNFGFDKPHTLLVQLQGQPFDRASASLAQVPGVGKMSGISMPMGTWNDGSDDVRTHAGAERVGVRDYFIDHRYLDHFGIKLAAGKPFPENPAQQCELFAIVNTLFVQQFKLGVQPGDAIGKSILVGDSLYLTIRGVTEDFPFKPGMYAPEPLLLRYNPTEWQVLNLDIAAGDPIPVLAVLTRNWKKLEPDQPFQAEFYDETVRGVYAEMLDLGRIVGFFGLLGLIIACMGLLGMAIYTVESKAKEISIRKVIGAQPRDIVVQLTKGYLGLLGIAVLIAVPLCYLLGSQMLQTFADRIPLSAGVFLPGVLLLLVVAGVTVGSQTVWAALSSPVQPLRSE